MKNKEIISKLKDMAELACASYGYFHLANPNYKPHESDKDGKRLAEFRKRKREAEKHITDQELQNIYPSNADILNIEYKYFKDGNGKLKDSWYHKHFLGGDFAPTQAKNFFEKYDLLIHQPNTDSGFSATLFGEKKLQIHNATKEKSYTSQYGYVDYILAIRGTEKIWIVK